MQQSDRTRTSDGQTRLALATVRTRVATATVRKDSQARLFLTVTVVTAHDGDDLTT